MQHDIHFKLYDGGWRDFLSLRAILERLGVREFGDLHHEHFLSFRPVLERECVRKLHERGHHRLLSVWQRLAHDGLERQLFRLGNAELQNY